MGWIKYCQHSAWEEVGHWGHRKVGQIFQTMNVQASTTACLGVGSVGHSQVRRQTDGPILTRWGSKAVRCLSITLAALWGRREKERKSARSSLPAPNWENWSAGGSPAQWAVTPQRGEGEGVTPTIHTLCFTESLRQMHKDASLTCIWQMRRVRCREVKQFFQTLTANKCWVQIWTHISLSLGPYSLFRSKNFPPTPQILDLVSFSMATAMLPFCRPDINSQDRLWRPLPLHMRPSLHVHQAFLEHLLCSCYLFSWVLQSKVGSRHSPFQYETETHSQKNIWGTTVSHLKARDCAYVFLSCIFIKEQMNN